jgi:hypothetical protein
LSKTVILLPFEEGNVNVRPSDVAGGIEDMVKRTGDATPVIVDALTGRGRQFGDGIGLMADDVSDAALLQRDVTVQAIVTWDMAAAYGDGQVQGLVIGAGKAWQLQLQVIDAYPGRLVGMLYLGWASVAEPDPLLVNDPGLFIPPSATGFFMVTAARRWISATAVETTYFLNDAVLSRVTSEYGDIDGAAADLVTVGAQAPGAPASNYFYGVIDCIKVTDYPMTAEEVRQTWRRIATHQPDGWPMIRACLPPGKGFPTDPASGVQQELAVEGDAVGKAFSKLEELREDYSPERAWSLLDDWERICKLPPKLVDSVEVRRNRVLSFLRKVEGYSVEGVKDLLSAALDLDPSLIQILEYTNTWTDEFDTIASWWTQFKDAGTAAVVAGELQIELNNTANGIWPAADPTVVYHCIDGDPKDADPSAGADATVRVTALNLANGCHAGLMMWNLVNEFLWFGFYRTGGVTKLGWRKYTDGVLGAFNALADPAPALPVWLRLQFVGGTVWKTFHSVNAGQDFDINPNPINPGITKPISVGLVLMQDTTPNPALASVVFDRYRGYFPNGLRPFNWYAYRDPALAGSPDLPGSRAIVAKLKPAETEASAVTVTTVKCDSADSLCDDGPLG